MITRLTIQHYRSIENLDLALGPVNVLVGRNGAGKSNIIDALKFVRDALRHGLDHAVTQRHGITNIRQWSPTRPYNITIGIEAERTISDDEGRGVTDSAKFSFTLSSIKNGFSIQRESGKFIFHHIIRRNPDGTIARRQFAGEYTRDHNGTVTYSDGNDVRIESIKDGGELFIGSRYSLFMAGFSRSILVDLESYAIFPNTLRQPEKQSTETHLAPHGQNLASVLKRMKRERRTEALDEIISSMRSVIPDLEEIPIQSVGGYIVPRFKIRDRETDKTHLFDVDQLSDGSLRILGLLVALYQDPIPATVALEEPELTVHPGALRIISDSIAEVGQNTQVLVTTHSPEFLDRFDPSQIIAVEYVDGKTQARPLAHSQVEAVRQNLFSLGQLMSMEGLHG